MRTWPEDWEDRRRGLNCPACAEGRPEHLTLGNRLPHLHTHIVPRFLDDPDPERPPRLMMVDRAWPSILAKDYARQLDDLRSSILRLQIEGQATGQA